LKKYGFGRGKTEKEFWGVTKKEGRGFLKKIKFYKDNFIILGCNQDCTGCN
jgi:hypothetical protein